MKTTLQVLNQKIKRLELFHSRSELIVNAMIKKQKLLKELFGYIIFCLVMRCIVSFGACFLEQFYTMFCFEVVEFITILGLNYLLRARKPILLSLDITCCQFVEHTVLIPDMENVSFI